jgi:acid phosphatase type 7
MNRREFAGSLSGLAAMMAAPTVLLGQTKPKPGPDTLFLTWQGDPTTTMTVQWVGEALSAADAAVAYCPIDWANLHRIHPQWTIVQPTKKPFPLTELTNHRAELTGLAPGTEYLLKIGANSPTYRFRTMPAKATNELTFVSGGDAGVNVHVIENNKLAAKQEPRFAVIGGDLAYDNGTNPKTYLQWLRDYSKHMVDPKGRLIPMVPILGNHEVKGGYNKPRSEAPFFFAHFDGLYKDTSYATLDFGDYLSLILMDTGHVSKIAGAQTDWLERVLKEREERAHVFVVNHVPCYPSFRPAEVVTNTGDKKAGTGEDQRKFWVPLFERYNVDVVLEHHDHTFKRTHNLTGGLKDKYGVLYLGDGSWGKQRAADKADLRSYIAKASTSYHFSIHRLEPETRYHMAMEDTGKIVDVVHSEKKPRKRG